MGTGRSLPLNPVKGPKMKSLAAIVTPLLVTVGVANAGDIVIKPKASDGTVVLRLSAGKILEASPGHAANTGEIAIKPKSSDSACMSSEHFGQLAWQFKRMSGSSGLKVQVFRLGFDHVEVET
jgi:hypothetical protein